MMARAGELDPERAGRLELRFPNWASDGDRPTDEEHAAIRLCCAAILKERDSQGCDAELRISNVICGLYGLGEGAVNAIVVKVTDQHSIIEVRNN